jgi:penicillin-binding protein 2
MSVAGWQEHIAQNMHVYCNGSATFYGRNSKCWVYFMHTTHGDVDLAKAIYQSCDVFFYTLADKLGIDRIAKYATQLGLGQKTGIDLPQEASGLIPSEEWKAKTFHQKWYAGETIFVGIGQGAITVTPVQLLRAISAISMGGKMTVPHVTNPSDLPKNYTEAAHFTDVTDVPLDPEGWNYITDAMERVLEPGGTSPLAAIKGIEIAGKTGSAQVVSLENRAKHKDNADLAQNGWFVGFTPRRNPDVVVCVLFQGGEHGKLAARLATQVIKAYVDKQRRTPTKMVEQPKPDGKVDIGGLWSDPDGNGHDALQGGRFVMDLSKTRMPVATAAPGMVPAN